MLLLNLQLGAVASTFEHPDDAEAAAIVQLRMGTVPFIVGIVGSFLPTPCVSPPEVPAKQKWGTFQKMNPERRLEVLRLMAKDLKATKQREKRLSERFLKAREKLAALEQQEVMDFAAAGRRLNIAVAILKEAKIPDFLTSLINGLVSGVLPVTAPLLVPLSAYSNIGRAPSQWRFTNSLKAHATLATCQGSAKSCYDQFRGLVGAGLGQGLASVAREEALLKEGDHVKARWLGKRKYYPGRISADNGDRTFAIQYEDGDFEYRVHEDLIKTLENGWSAIVARTNGILPSLETVASWGKMAYDNHASCDGRLSIANIQDCRSQVSCVAQLCYSTRPVSNSRWAWWARTRTCARLPARLTTRRPFHPPARQSAHPPSVCPLTTPSIASRTPTQ